MNERMEQLINACYCDRMSLGEPNVSCGDCPTRSYGRPSVTSTNEYRLIIDHYYDRRARRSQVPLINHINEGLIVLNHIGGTEDAMRAFCIHPLLQADIDLAYHHPIVNYSCSSTVVMLAMEYRSVANEYLSDKVFSGNDIRLSPLQEVNKMLIADKVQNRKDFITYHRGTHPKSNILDIYFNEWLDALGVTEEMYQAYCRIIDDGKGTD